MENQTTSQRLKNCLTSITSGLRALLQDIKVERAGLIDDLNRQGIAVVAPPYRWRRRTPQQEKLRISIKRDYESFFEMLKLMLRQAPNDIMWQFSQADKGFRMWIDLGSNWGLSDNMAINLREFDEAAGSIADILAIFNQNPDKRVILIPDTNSLLVTCDPVEYRKIANHEAFTFLLLPTVLSELDKLKMQHKNPEVREKAQKVIKRIKGWRNQGRLNDGVMIDKTIIVQSLYKDPNMNDTLSWLDSSVQDDKILASILSVQAENASSIIYLVTGDINLQNKADAAFISTLEIP